MSSATRAPFRLWLEWQHYYADPDLSHPQIVAKGKVVFDTNIAAAKHGIVPGMALHQALPLAPGCVVKPWKHDPARAESWLYLCTTFSDVIQQGEEHQAVLDLSAHPDPLDIALRLIERLQEFALLPPSDLKPVAPLTTEEALRVHGGDLWRQDYRVPQDRRSAPASMPTPAFFTPTSATCARPGAPYGLLRCGTGPATWVAMLACRYGAPLLTRNDSSPFLATLPTADLIPVDESDRHKLETLGYRTIGAVAQLSLDILLRQFGTSAYTIARAARGEHRDAIVSTFPAGCIQESLRFDGPVNDAQVIEAAWGTIARNLAQKLTGQQALTIAVTLELETEEEVTRQRNFKRPVYDLTGIVASLRVLGTTIPEQECAIVRLTARLSGLEPIRTQQPTFHFAKQQAHPDDCIKTLQAALGDNAIVRASRIESPRRKRILQDWRHATGWN